MQTYLCATGADDAERLDEIRAAVLRHGGTEQDGHGAAILAVFPSPSAAVAAAASAGTVVRVGLHTCDPRLDGEEEVRRAARIAAAAHPGQVLLSAATRHLIDDDVQDLGLHHLRDLPGAQRLYQLGADMHQPLATLVQTNLPASATRFHGRVRDLDEIAALLRRDDVRLLTLVGAGGTGKTRLAIEAAGRAADRYPEGVWWVSVAALSDWRAVLPSIAATLGVVGDLEVALEGKHLLVVVDNLEHLLDAAEALSSLLGRCPGLDLLTTSRSPLRVAAEWQHEVAPLAPAEAAAFLRERVAAVRRDVVLGAEADAICERLDCLPLALELAAVRLRVLSPAALLTRLDHSLPLLAAGARDAPQRQQTLRATIAWSHELLSPAEQALFARLGIFAGSFGLDAVEAVCEADVETLAGLVDKSLVRQHDDRFSMLATIREYARDLLAAGDEAETLGRRHLSFHVQQADAARDTVLWGGDEPGEVRAWFELLAHEWPDMLAAIELAVRLGEAEQGLSIGEVLFTYLESQGRLPVASELREELLAAASDDELGRYADVCAAAVKHATWYGGSGDVRRHVDRLPDGWRHMLGAFVAQETDPAADAEQLWRDAAVACAAAGEPRLEARCRLLLADLHVARGAYAEALEIVEPLLDPSRPPLQLWLRTMVSFVQSMSLAGLGLDDRARRAVLESMRLLLESGTGGGPIWIFPAALAVAWERDDPARAAAIAAAALRLRRDAGIKHEAVPHFDGLNDRLALVLGESAARAAADRGERLSVEDVLRFGDPAVVDEAADAAETLRGRYQLTAREIEVLGLLASGMTNAAIARTLFISPNTTAVHVSRILSKLGVDGRVQAARVALQLGLAPDRTTELPTR